MITGKKPLTLAEVKEYTKDSESQPLIEYMKSFSKLSTTNASKLTEELVSLNNLKMKEEDIVKLVDFLPKDAEDLNKIFLDVSLSEEESNTILAVIKKY